MEAIKNTPMAWTPHPAHPSATLGVRPCLRSVSLPSPETVRNAAGNCCHVTGYWESGGASGASTGLTVGRPDQSLTKPLFRWWQVLWALRMKSCKEPGALRGGSRSFCSQVWVRGCEAGQQLGNGGGRGTETSFLCYLQYTAERVPSFKPTWVESLTVGVNPYDPSFSDLHV